MVVHDEGGLGRKEIVLTRCPIRFPTWLQRAPLFVAVEIDGQGGRDKSGFQPLVVVGLLYPGRWPGLVWDAPSVLETGLASRWDKEAKGAE